MVLERDPQHEAEKPTSAGLSLLGHYFNAETWCVASGVSISLEIPHAGQTSGIFSANLRNLRVCFWNWPGTWGCTGGCGGSLSHAFHAFAFSVPYLET